MNDNQSASGVLSAFAAFLIWGSSPIYWRALAQVGAFEIIVHRIIWSALFLFLLVMARRRWPELKKTITSPKLLFILMGTSLLVGGNWLVYVWAVTHDRVLQASLGYYINPLVNVVLGMIFLHERLRRAQTVAVLLATFGVLNLTLRYGSIPWVSLTLAFSFGTYGLVRKMASIGPLMGLSVEMLLLSVPASVWVWHLVRTPAGSFLHFGWPTDLLLLGTGIFTATPLLLFNFGAKRITLATLGFIQYTAPTGMFLLGVTLFHEPFTHVEALTFLMIWTALAIYSWDTVRLHRKRVIMGVEKRRPSVKIERV
jgi:chloramphenicol-sensitive protein RarD